MVTPKYLDWIDFFTIAFSYNYKLKIVEHVIFFARDRNKLNFWRSI